MRGIDVNPISDTIYTEYPYACIFRHIETDGGTVTAFVIELEYGLDDKFYWPNECDDWRPVARFDHNPASQNGHDIREEGLHIDIYKGDGEYESTADFLYVHVNEAPRWCEEYFKRNLDFSLERYEKFHDLNGRWTVSLRQ